MVPLQYRSFRAANKRIIVQRYTHDDDNSGVFKDFRENIFTRWIIIAFSVPQMVKLFALQGPGVIATQVCAGMFLGSFFVVEFLVVLRRPHTLVERPVELAETTSDVRFPYSTIAASTCFMLYTIIHALVSLFEAHGLALNALQITGLTILFFESMAFVPSGLHSHFLRRNGHCEVSQEVDPGTKRQNVNKTSAAQQRHHLPANGQPQVSQVGIGAMRQIANETNAAKPRNQLLVQNILLLLVHAIPVAYWLFSHLISPKRRDALGPMTSNIVALIMIVIWANLCLPWAYVTFKAVRASGRETTRRVEIILSWYFWSLHLIGALLYYRYVYEATGTVKPTWTEQLGRRGLRAIHRLSEIGSFQRTW